MDTWIYFLWALLLVLASGSAWLTTLFTLPGNWLIAGFAALFAWLIPINDGRGVDWRTVFVLLGLALFGEIIEFGASAAGAAKQGGANAASRSRWSARSSAASSASPLACRF